MSVSDMPLYEVRMPDQEYGVLIRAFNFKQAEKKFKEMFGLTPWTRVVSQRKDISYAR